MKKIICLLFGHKEKMEQCPFTGAKLLYCTRCSSDPHQSKMTFN